MDKLKKLYRIIEYSKDTGVTFGKDVLRQVEELEEKIIKDEILPALSKDIAPRLEPIKRDVVLVVEYHPGEPISVALSRKAKISEIVDTKTLTPKSSTAVKSEVVSSVPQNIVPTKGLRVIFPDGSVVWNRRANRSLLSCFCLSSLRLSPFLKVSDKCFGIHSHIPKIYYDDKVGSFVIPIDDFPVLHDNSTAVWPGYAFEQRFHW